MAVCKPLWHGVFMLWLLLACSQPSPERNALDERVEFGVAWKACKGLMNPEKAGQCALDVLQTRKVVSTDRCAEISSERWRSECFFIAAETGKGSLSEQYQVCSKAGEYARDCGFHLWQRDLMALEPGNPATADGIRIRAGTLFRKHRPFAEPLDYSFEETFWTWFWGAWWEQRAASMPGDKSACLWWTDASDRADCERWAEPAAKWMSARNPPAG